VIDTQNAIAELAANEPIDWLFGRVLRAGIARGESHFILEALSGRNPHAVKAWNAWIAEFRSVLRQPDSAATKADSELSTSPLSRIEDFMTEVLAVVHLSRNGYQDFEVVLAGNDKKAVDFTARRSGKHVRVEIKNLREPEDIIQTVAKKRWEKCRGENPARYNFPVLLSHEHSGALTEAAENKLKNVIDQIPDFATPERQIALDGNVSIVIKRLGQQIIQELGAEGEMVSHMTHAGREPRLIVQTPIRAGDLEFNLPELQGLFVKSFRVVAGAIEKFFGRQSNPEAENVMVLRWQAPAVFYDEETPQIVRKAIEAAFDAVGLQLTVFVLGSDPEPNFRFTG